MWITLVTGREDMDRVFEVGHGWGGRRRNEAVGGAGGISRRGWGILRHIQPEPRVFYVGDGKSGRFVSGARMNNRPPLRFSVAFSTLPPASQQSPVPLPPSLAERDSVLHPLSRSPKLTCRPPNLPIRRR